MRVFLMHPKNGEKASARIRHWPHGDVRDVTASAKEPLRVGDTRNMSQLKRAGWIVARTETINERVN